MGLEWTISVERSQHKLSCNSLRVWWHVWTTFCLWIEVSRFKTQLKYRVKVIGGPITRSSDDWSKFIFQILSSAISLPPQTFIFIFFLTCASLVSLLFLEFVLSGKPHYWSGHRAISLSGLSLPFPKISAVSIFSDVSMHRASLHLVVVFTCINPTEATRVFSFYSGVIYMSLLVTKGELGSLNSAIIVPYYEVQLLMGIFPLMTASLCCFRTLI